MSKQIESLVDGNIDRVMVCVARHGAWFAYWCLRQQGIPRITAYKMLWIASRRRHYEDWVDA